MLIETEEHAKARGAPIIARLMGVATNSDGYDDLRPDPSGERAADAIARAVELAGLQPGDIDHVNAHATGTAFGDQAEAQAIRRALPGHAPAVYAPKAALGHSLGAAGAVEAVLTVQALRDGIIPATRNVRTSTRTSASTSWSTGRGPAATGMRSATHSASAVTTPPWSSGPADYCLTKVN